MLIRTPGATLHRQLFMVLREQIVRGVYAAGAALPPEGDLCAYFGVSRITVRRALADLKEQGLLDRRQGRRTIVSATPRAHSHESMNFLQALQQRGHETKVKVLALQTARPPGTVAMQMQLGSDEEAVYCARLRHFGRTPLVVTEAWLPLQLGGKITRAQLNEQLLYDILVRNGVAFGRVIEEITAVSANPDIARLLHTGVGVPLLRVTRLLYGTDRQPVEHLTIHLSPERSRILLNVPPEELAHTASPRIVHDLVLMKH